MVSETIKKLRAFRMRQDADINEPLRCERCGRALVAVLGKNDTVRVICPRSRAEYPFPDEIMGDS